MTPPVPPPMLELPALSAIAAAALLAFALSAAQSWANGRHGSDNTVHGFLVRAIRHNGHRLFVRIPRLVNEAFIGALPLYLHWIVALRPRLTRAAELFLNPVMNGLHVVLVGHVTWQVAAQVPNYQGYVAGTAMLFALTPQFLHIFSARNFGMSARSLGLVLLTIALFAAWQVEARVGGWPATLLLVVACYLLWAFSTFGAQALVILAVLLTAIAGRPQLLAGAAGGLAVFVVVHPRYSAGYLKHTYRYIRGYAAEVAGVYILARRYSIWRDLVRDIPRQFAHGTQAGLRYAYENSVVIVVLLNPLLILTIAARLFGLLPANPILEFASDVALCGGLAMLLTSFRPTRFLGEPERYVEAVTPWSTLAGTAIVLTWAGQAAVWVLIGAFLVASLVQLQGSRMLARYLVRKPTHLADAEAAIAAHAGAPIVCCSNNEQLTKLLMRNDWEFSVCLTVGNGYCGMRFDEAFDPFPFLTREAFERIVAAYRVNICVMDTALYDLPFETPPPGLVGCRAIYKSEGLQVWTLDWEDQVVIQRTLAAA